MLQICCQFIFVLVKYLLHPQKQRSAHVVNTTHRERPERIENVPKYYELLGYNMYATALQQSDGGLDSRELALLTLRLLYCCTVEVLLWRSISETVVLRLGEF